MLSLLTSFLFCIRGFFPMHSNFQVPSPIKDARISSPFGLRQDPFTSTMKFHSGVDFSAEIGEPIQAVAKGHVIYSGEHGGFGNLVVIRHSDNLTTHYAHLWAPDVFVGQHIQSGETLGFVGESGKATGPHLHFEVRWNGTPIDPRWLIGR